MKSNIILLTLAFLLCLSLPFSGCQPPQAPQVQTVPPAVGELNLLNIDPITLDPAVSGEMTSHGYILQIFSGLVRLDADLEVVADVAEKWQVSGDGMKYTFDLRRGVYFHDGRQVKASDFKYSWERACDPTTGSHTASVYLNDIVGVKDVLAGKTREISGIKVVDDYTLQVTLDAPKSYFLSKLTYPTTFVVDKSNVKSGGEWWRKPNGTGPFQLKKWEENNLLVLARNERYHGQIPSVKQVNFRLLGGIPMVMYETGEIDATGISINYLDRVTDPAGPFLNELQIIPELSFSYIGFDHTKPPFDDINIRLAFSQAINKDKIISVLLRDMVERADGILPPGMPGYNENLAGLEYDVNRAKQLIAESSYGNVENLPPVTITTSGWGGLISSELEVIIQEWRDNLGVKVKVRQLEPERFLYYLREEKDEMFMMGWIADYPHPQDFLEILFATGAESNYGDFSGVAVDALLQEAAVVPDYQGSLALYQQAEQKLIDDAACIPLWFGKNYILVKPYVRGYHLSPIGIAMLNEVSIKQE
ncbi:peptide ABC transporter substrate-binding protein [Chloroflexota bacterium]